MILNKTTGIWYHKIMKKSLTIIIVSCFFLLLNSSVEKAQTPEVTTIDKGYVSYLAAFDSYRSNHQGYETAKSAYLQYKTPTAQQDLLEQGKKVIIDRDNVIINYLNYLLLRLVISPGVDFTDQTIYQPKIKQEIQFYTIHRDSVNAISNLSDLTEKSKDTEKQYKQTIAAIDQTLGIILLGKTKLLSSNVDKFNQLLTSILTLTTVNSDNSQKVNQWLLDAKNRQLLSQNQSNDALKEFNKLITYTGDSETAFNAGKSKVLQSFQYLKESFGFLKQITEIISNG